MADLFQGSAPPNVTTTRETAAVAPQYLTDYLTQLAQQGQQSLGTFDKTTGQYTTPTQEQLSAAGKPYVAPLSTLQNQVIQAAPETLTRYQTPMDEALAAGQAGASIDQGDISKFYNPYEAAVIGDMATRSATNVQRNLMPQLKAGFVNTGGLGGIRYANALGQTLGDTESNLLQEQNKYKAAGYQSALDAALKEMSGQTQAGQMLGTLGAQEQQAATTGLKTGADIGAIEQAQNQALINAPTTMAGNVAQILRGYTYPTVTTEKTQGPASSYGPSILSQIGGLGSLIAAGTNKDQTGLFDRAFKYVGGLLPDNSSGFTPQSQSQSEANYSASLGDFNG
jgi:hypothetical protein